MNDLIDPLSRAVINGCPKTWHYTYNIFRFPALIVKEAITQKCDSSDAIVNRHSFLLFKMS